jgi:poly-gamma-glutamate capsule biosynthesis protein CapA/YwtB (metallophosphatase superfamily)
LWLAVILACQEPHTVHPPPPLVVVELGHARLVATGDVLMHGSVKEAAASADDTLNHSGYLELFREVAPAVQGADLAFLNLETPIAPSSGKGTRSMVFNAPPAVLDALVATGFDVISFANNHVYDQGRTGFVETLEHLDATPLRYIGADKTCADALAPEMIVVDGIQLAWMAVTESQNDWLNRSPTEPCVAELHPQKEQILAAVAQARRDGADLVVLSMHWGYEYELAPRRYQHEMAHELVEGGVDVLLGHHPHVLQPVETVKAADGRVAVVAYSLGNFVSNQSASYDPARDSLAEGNPRDGVLLGIEVSRRRYGREPNTFVRTELAGIDLTPLWTAQDPSVVPAIWVEPGVARREHALSVLNAPLAHPEDASQLSRR